MGRITGEVMFLDVPVEMKVESGSHVRLLIWVEDWEPQSMRKPLGGVVV